MSQTDQVTVQQLVKIATGSSFGLTITATIVLVIGLLLPFVGISTNLGMGFDQSASMNGFAAAGWVAILALIAFVGAIAARKVTQAVPYRNIVDWVGVGLAVLTIVWAWFFNPAKADAAQAREAMSLLGATGELINITPHVGMIVVLIAAGLLAYANRKAVGE